MPRSALTNNDHDHSKPSTTDEMNNHQHKRSLEDYGFFTNLKRRRHLSPQNANIDHNNDTESPSSRKKARTKSKNHSSLDTTNDCPTPRKSSSRHGLSSQQMNEIHLPNWERMCPNIDQILSNKHAQSGVFAHEVQLVQQELEALLSMAIVRENILKDLSKPSINHSDSVRSKIRKHQEAERVYSTKKISKKLLPSVNHQANGSQKYLDRQVALAPILGAQIDRIWSNINTYHHQISSNDILTIENLVTFHSHLQSKIEQYQTDPSNVVEQLNEENYEQLIGISQIHPLITHYVDRTSLGSFQTKLYEHIGQTSPVYKTPISSPMHGRILGNNVDSTLRISPRLHSKFSLSHFKFDDDSDFPPSSSAPSTSFIKSKKKNKYISSPSSAVKLQQRLQTVHNYLLDQHPILSETVKRQLFADQKSTRKRKNSLSISLPLRINHINNDHCTDNLQSKLSTLVSLLHECSVLSNCALKRARLQSDNEQTWQKLQSIEHELATVVEKLATTSNHHSNAQTEKASHHLTQLLIDWKKYEDEFNQQLVNINA